MSGIFFAKRPLMLRRSGGCPLWGGTTLTIDTTPLTKWLRATSVYATLESHTLALGSIIEIAFCMTRAPGTEMTVFLSPNTTTCYLFNFQTDNNDVVERYDTNTHWDGVLYGQAPGSQTMAGINGIDALIAVGSGSNDMQFTVNPGTAFANSARVLENRAAYNFIGSANKVYVGPGSNGLAAIYDIRSRIDPGTRLTPSIVQRASRRGDGAIALPSAPTVGNMLLFIPAGFSGSLGSYVPAGFTEVKPYDGDSNNRVNLWRRFVQAGDTGSYSVSASDNQGCALLEIANADFIVAAGGGSMTSAFSGSSFSLTPVASGYDSTSLRIVAMEQDPVRPFTITPATGLTVEYQSPTDGLNHTGAVVSLTSAFSGNVTGSISGGGSSGATRGQWLILGRVA